MRNEQAINHLRIWADSIEKASNNLHVSELLRLEIKEDADAMKMAIAALEKQESIRNGKWIHDNVPVCCLACLTCKGKHTCAYYLSECAEKQVSPDMEDKDELDITSD